MIGSNYVILRAVFSTKGIICKSKETLRKLLPVVLLIGLANLIIVCLVYIRNRKQVIEQAALRIYKEILRLL